MSTTVREEYAAGNPAAYQQAVTVCAAANVQRQPFVIVTGEAGCGKTHLTDTVALYNQSEWDVHLNVTDLPPSILKGLTSVPLAGSKTPDEGVPLCPTRHDVPIHKKYGSKRGMWKLEELGNANTISQTQFQDVVSPSKKGPYLSGWKLATKMYIMATGNRAGLDGASAKAINFPLINRGLNITYTPDMKAFLSIVANDSSMKPETLINNVPWTLEFIESVKATIDDPAGTGVAKSLVYDWSAWEHKTGDNRIVVQPESYRGQQCCTPRSLEYAMRASMLPWDYGSEVFAIMLRGYLGTAMGDKCCYYINEIMETKNVVYAWKSGDKAALSADPSEQYRFCLAALEVLQSEQGVIDQGVNVALHNKAITGWFTDELFNTIDAGVAEWLFEKCTLKGIMLAEVEGLRKLK